MIKVPMTVIVSCDNCHEERRFTGEYPYGISESDLIEFYLFDDWRSTVPWSMNKDGKVFCSTSCREDVENG